MLCAEADLGPHTLPLCAPLGPFLTLSDSTEVFTRHWFPQTTPPSPLYYDTPIPSMLSTLVLEILDLSGSHSVPWDQLPSKAPGRRLGNIL